MVRLDFCLGACPEELLDTLVPEVLYHPYSVYYRYTRRKGNRSAQKCYQPCLRYVVSPMSPDRTLKDWSGREDLNLRPPGPEVEVQTH